MGFRWRWEGESPWWKNLNAERALFLIGWRAVTANFSRMTVEYTEVMEEIYRLCAPAKQNEIVCEDFLPVRAIF